MSTLDMTKKKNKVTKEVEEQLQSSNITFCVEYNETSTGGERESDEPYSNRAPCYISTTFTSISLNAPKWESYKTIQAPRELANYSTLYLVVVKYSDGDTFGTTYGYTELWSLHASMKEAEQAVEELPASNGYKAWTGYFARLEDIIIEPLTLSK